MLITESIVLGAWGPLSLILLIVWLRWVGTWEDQKKDEPPKVPKGNENAKQETNDQSVGSARASISLETRAPSERAIGRLRRSAKVSRVR
jgi:hypothetical protein